MLCYLIVNPKTIVHRGKPEDYEQMVLDCAKNVRLTKNATRLLVYYAERSNGFKPALAEIERATGIFGKSISTYRKQLITHGLIGYGEDFGNMLVVDWNRIHIFAMLERPLDFEKKNSENYFSVVQESYRAAMERRDSKKSLLERGKRYKISGIDEKKDLFLQLFGGMTEREYVDLVTSFPEYDVKKQKRLLSDAEYAKRVNTKIFHQSVCEECKYSKEDQEQYEKNIVLLKSAPQLLPF